MAILITGGAGYIGSVTAARLCEAGEAIVVLDDLSRGHRAALPEAVPFHEGRVGDRALVARIVDEHAVDACIHFAALAYVGESVSEPALYFENNVAEGIALLGSLVERGVRHFVFSSTCATYGEPREVPIPEDHPQWPANPYGWSKLVLERVLASYSAAYGLRYVALRYFNAAGATPRLGEHHEPETHLIPLVLDAAAGRRSHVAVFGTDYPTPDGTAIRDYVHVLDLAEAHAQALDYLRGGGASDSFNLGTGTGSSVLEVVEAARRVTGRPIEIRPESRRPGDPARLVAAGGRAGSALGWQPRHADLTEIVESAWRWRLAHPEGYGSS
jgi:UDP-glucose-4-epimerase GalE